MGRNKSHQKQLRSEKAKIKLKDNKTKFLPKGQNVTDASFKIKPIVLPEQLKTYGADVILSRRNLPIKELLDRLDHHNKTTKEDACEQLREVFELNDSVNIGFLPKLLKRLCPLILHEEQSVRQKVLKTLDVILSKANITSPTALTPFHPILISFLRSALTHIKRPIREDSLYYLDLLLRHVPRMLAAHADTLLPVYLSLISTHGGAPSTATSPSPNKVVKKVGSVGAQRQPTFNVDLSSGMTSVVWRVKVLGRLYTMLETIGRRYGEEVESSSEEVPFLDITGNKPYPLIIDYFSDTAETLYNYNEQNSESRTGSIENNIKDILWILFNTWAEVSPDGVNNLNNSEDTILRVETAEILNGILKIIFLLWHNILNKSQISELTTNTADRFLNGLLSLFPFHKRITSSKRQNGQSGDVQKCSQENLILCYIFAIANPKLYKQDKIELGRKVAAYLNACLISKSIVKNNITYLARCLSVIFKQNASNWHKGNSVNMEELLTNTINFQITTAFNKELFNVLCDLIQEKSLRSLPAYAIFLSNIPSLLCKKEVSADTITKIHWISVQQNKVFYTSFLECMPEILNNFTDIQIIDSVDNLYNNKLKILYMFENCPHVSNLQMEYFKAFVENFNEENEYSSYVRNWILKDA